MLDLVELVEQLMTSRQIQIEEAFVMFRQFQEGW